MFYIVETQEQLNEFFNIGHDKVFVEPILYNDNVHPALNHVSLLLCLSYYTNNLYLNFNKSVWLIIIPHPSIYWVIIIVFFIF